MASNGAVVMTGDDIVAGKGGFQTADLMDYGSLYGTGRYYGEDFTAAILVKLGVATREAMLERPMESPLPRCRSSSRRQPPPACGMRCRGLT